MKQGITRLTTKYVIVLTAFVLSNCATSNNPKIVSFDTPKPHYTIANSCKKKDLPKECGDAIEKAIPEIGELIKQLNECDASLSACQQHSGVDEHFWTSTVATKDAELEREKWKKWYWSITALAAGVVTGFLLAR